MEDGFVVELALIGVLILLNAFFAGAEMAVVSARTARLRALAEDGNPRAAAALRLKLDPDRFLATVQVGVTLVGTLASAVGGVAAIERLEPAIAALPWPWLRALAEPLAVAIVVFTIAYLSLVVGACRPQVPGRAPRGDPLPVGGPGHRVDQPAGRSRDLGADCSPRGSSCASSPRRAPTPCPSTPWRTSRPSRRRPGGRGSCRRASWPARWSSTSVTSARS